MGAITGQLVNIDQDGATSMMWHAMPVSWHCRELATTSACFAKRAVAVAVRDGLRPTLRRLWPRLLRVRVFCNRLLFAAIGQVCPRRELSPLFIGSKRSWNRRHCLETGAYYVVDRALGELCYLCDAVAAAADADRTTAGERPTAVDSCVCFREREEH